MNFLPNEFCISLFSINNTEFQIIKHNLPIYKPSEKHFSNILKQRISGIYESKKVKLCQFDFFTLLNFLEIYF